jgi:hypothetical protein
MLDAGSCGHATKAAGDTGVLLIERGLMTICRSCWDGVCREFAGTSGNAVYVPELRAWVTHSAADMTWAMKAGWTEDQYVNSRVP